MFGNKKRNRYIEDNENFDWDMDDEEYSEDSDFAEDGGYTDDGMEYEADNRYTEAGAYADEDQYTDYTEYAEDGQYTENAEYVEDGQYTENVEYAEDGQYTEDIEYVEDVEYLEEGQYAEYIQYPEEGRYAEEIQYSEEDQYAENIGYREDEGYTDERFIADMVEDDAGYENTYDENAGLFYRLVESIKNMTAMDRLIMATAALVFLLVVVTGVVVLTSKGSKSATTFAQVGTQLEDIEVIGGEGIRLVANAYIERGSEVQEEVPEIPTDYDEEDYINNVAVKLNMNSVYKDLKIKFDNKETGKLVANVPFEVTITTPSGDKETWKDDNKDGIIYKKNIEAGTYKVSVNNLSDDKYSSYTLPFGTQSFDVKSQLEYAKIDVSDEVKTENEINVSQEDTAANDTVVESELQDTVAWVESTQTAETYVEIAKKKIADPATASQSGTVAAGIAPVDISVKATGVSEGDIPTVDPDPNSPFTLGVSQSNVSLKIGGKATVNATVSGATPGVSIQYSVSSGSKSVAASVDSDGNVTVEGISEGTATITLSAQYTTGEAQPVSTTFTVTVSGNPTIALDRTELTVCVGEAGTITATIGNATTNTPVTAKSSDKKIAKVSVDNKTVTVKGVAEGTATITVSYEEDGGNKVSEKCKVTVVKNPKDDVVTKLVDKDGNQVYVYENDKYREAVYADYYTFTKFFKSGGIKYTGWQTIDGKVYFFTADGVKVTGEQVIQGAKYTFASDGSLVTGNGAMGIDVSKWNGTIDWNAVKNSGVSYVIIRCGYRGSSQGVLVEDIKFKTNIKGATDAGLKVGVYFFTQATDEVEAVEEASFVLDLVKGYKISYPVFLDVEPSGGRGDKIDKATRTAVCKAFCTTIKNAGYTSGVYANKTWLTEKIDASALSAYKIWLAQYAASPTYTGRYDLWQYKSTGRVSGISGDVDMNLSYLGY